MAISNLTGGDARIEITTSALSETLGSQTQQTGNNTIILSDTFDNLANTDTEATIDYVDRLVLIRRGTGTEEERRVISDTAGTGTTRILTVHEDWNTVPASSDDCQFSYVIQDIATIGASFGLLNKRNTDYTSNKRLQIGDGTNFAYLAFLDGVSYETYDNSSTTEADVTVNGTGNPRFSNGYLFSGNPVSGGYFIGTPAVAGELTWECRDGGMCSLNDFFFTGIISHEFQFVASTTGSRVRGNKMKLFVQARELDLLAQDTQITDLTVEGSGNTSDIIRCRQWDSNGFIKDFKLISTNGLATRSADTSTETLEFRDITFINNSQLIEINSNKTWDIVNPVWNPTTADQTDFDFLTATSNVVNEKFSLDTTSQEVDGTALTSKVYVVKADNGAGSPALAHELTADASGLATADVLKRAFTDNAGTSVTTATHATFAVISTQYGQLPLITSYTPSNDDVSNGLFGNRLTFTHLSDTFQVETTQATAISNGAGIEFEIQATNPASIIKYTGGTGTLNVGNTVTGASSGADGVVVEILEGNSTAGTVLLDTRDANNFTGTETLNESGASSDWSATYTASSQRDFTNVINGNGYGSQTIYDWINAKADEATLDVTGTDAMDDVFFWANGGTNALPIVGDTIGSPNTFKTVRNVTNTSGWCVYNTTLGGWAEFVADDGQTFIPQSTVTVNTTTTSSETQNTIEGVRVAYYATPKSSGDSPISNGETNSSGLYTDSLTLSLPYNMTVTARKRGLVPFTVLVTIGAGTTTFDLTAPMGTDGTVDRRE